MSHHYIAFDNVYYKYPKAEDYTLRGVSFRINHGERVALTGLNGSGKSTLLLHTNGLLLAESGVVNVGDIPITKKTAPIVRQNVGLIFQNPDDMLFMPTISEDIEFGLRNMKLPESEIERRVKESLGQVNLLEYANYPAFHLSGGQRRSAAIATVLAMQPSILVLDEPSANLDDEARDALINILKSYHHTILLATHDKELANIICDKELRLENGRIA